MCSSDSSSCAFDFRGVPTGKQLGPPRSPELQAFRTSQDKALAVEAPMQKPLGAPRRGRRVLAVAASVTLFWTTVSLIPIYNKYFFQKKYYPFPIATAGVQLGCVAALLVAINVGGRIARGTGEEAAREKSWILGPHFLWKLKAVFPIGFLFGIKYGVTNLGLHLVPAPTHLLLQSTDLIWTLLGAWFINGERTSWLGLACLAGCVAGSFVLSIQVGQNAAAPYCAIAVNLLSPIILGLCISTLRSACVELMRKDNRVGGTVTSVELTALKLSISSVVALALAAMFEHGNEASDESGWLESFRNLPTEVKAGVLGGSLPILIFQVNCTFLTHLTSSVAVGLVGQLKIIPQWIVATIFSSNMNIHFTGLNIVGAMLTMISAAAFAVNEYFSQTASFGKRCSSVIDDEGNSGDETETSILIGPIAPDTSPEYGSFNV
ncbi:hypothetical protein ACHAWF_002903 [Thalassiosira exigua]